MKRDQVLFDRFREPWEVRRPPPASDADESPPVGSVDPFSPAGPLADPAHLVLTNDAAGREDALLGVAGYLAGRAGGSIRVAHVLESPPAGELDDVRRLAPTDHGGPVAEACDRLFRSARALAARTRLPVAPEVLVGPIGPTLTDYIRVNEFDAVTAATDATWLALWRGGVWSRVARERPVVVVGPGVSRLWPADAGPPREVLAILDGTAGAERILAPASALCRLLDARLTLLRVRPHDRAECDRYLPGVAERVRRVVPAVRTIAAAGAPAAAALAVQHATGAVVALCAPAASRLAAWNPGRLAVRVLRASTAPTLFYRPTL